MAEKLSYAQSGVDISVTDQAKKEMAGIINTGDKRVLNRFGAFASLCDGHFPGMKHPVLVLKTEEPGSKQKLAFDHGYVESICRDMINHLVNDIIVMGAAPLYVQDAIICGTIDKETVKKVVASISAACAENGCLLTGGETSVQPGVVPDGTYILTSSIVGVVDREAVIDGSKIEEGDRVVAVASNGLHTNGYSLVRKLMSVDKGIVDVMVGGARFMDAIMKPHSAYYNCVKHLFGGPLLRGMAHITGGGIEGNLNRILPEGLDASIDLPSIKVLPIFSFIKERGNVPDGDMLKTFNCGVGLALVVKKGAEDEVAVSIRSKGVDAYTVGAIEKGGQKVRFTGGVKW